MATELGNFKIALDLESIKYEQKRYTTAMGADIFIVTFELNHCQAAAIFDASGKRIVG